MARLFLGKEGADGAARLAESSRQRQRIRTATQRAEQSRADASEERAQLLAQARATHARVDREMDPETREQLRKTASKLMEKKDG